MSEVREVSAKEFAALDAGQVTVLDLREPDEVLVHPIEGALNVPFSEIATGLDKVPHDKPVYVICRTGDWSGEVAELLADRDYEVYDVVGGFAALGDVLRACSQQAADAPGGSEEAPPVEHLTTAEEGAAPEPLYIDARELRCPGPIVKVADTLRELPDGTRVRVDATEDAFASDVAVWAERTGNTLESLEVAPGNISAVLRKGSDPEGNAPTDSGHEGNAPAAEERHDKTFVVFSGDLDKTIAAFIMANGGAAMGRQVTMFFTFWGLNILRKPKRVRVAKNLVERAFGLMMPRGTLRLGLSRMNMLGMGPKMIRWIMREKGISSLEELIADARAHGVRIVACQMSMDIMGIRQEELIDGVELGGVATFLGSGERSDVTFFI